MILATFLLMAAPAFAEWQAGAARADLTPQEPIWMAGYAARTKPSEGVRQKIWAKALALRDEKGAAAVIVTLDLVGIRRPLAEDLAGAITSKHKIPRDRILFNASHTHSAPLVGGIDSYVHIMGDQAPKHAEIVKRYTAQVRARILEAVDGAMAGLAPATLEFEQGFAGFAVNRRRVGNRQYPGPVDHDVPVLAVRGSDNKLRAILFGYACHNTVLGDYEINGDYAGYAQEALEKLNPGAVALFVQGAGADSNPLPRRSVELAQRYGSVLGDAVDQVLKAKMMPVRGPLSTSMETIELRFAAPPSRAELEQRLTSKDATTKRHAERMIEKLNRDGKLVESHPYPVQAWRFGKDMTLLTLAGELVVDFSLRFKGRYGWDKLWVAGYSNDVFGYIPSLRVLKEGGYEGGGAMLFGGFPGPFADDVEERVAAAVERVMKQSGAALAAAK
ncbi:MAG: neutral/alkaline non-lysosomal ceramidase N-terminal domain-containing protein [Bryobacterales bacterium]|nr:neutral/alkaline non-lysosomal ceramidase N-terminal domain-containing protein [Bryobacterales bacterium]